MSTPFVVPAPKPPSGGASEQRSPVVGPTPTRARPRGRRPRRDEAPPAPWGAFPLVELCVLVALALGVTGFLTGGRTGLVLIACALALGSLAGLELSIREHLAGYRSHTSVLAAAVAVAVLAILYFTHVSRPIMVPVGVAVGATAFWLLRGVFRRRSGGFGFRA